MIIIAGSSSSTGSVSRATPRATAVAAWAAARARRRARLPELRAHPANSSSIFLASSATACCGVAWPFITFWISPSKMFAPSRPPHFGDGG